VRLGRAGTYRIEFTGSTASPFTPSRWPPAELARGRTIGASTVRVRIAGMAERAVGKGGELTIGDPLASIAPHGPPQ
jgi:hypothetical protein